MNDAVIVATARNEGPFVVEWVAHHLALGFKKIFIATNDCEDGTDRLVELLSNEANVYHIDNATPLEGETIQTSAVRRCLAHAEMPPNAWVLHIDLDEFLDLSGGAKTVDDFLKGYNDCDVVSLCWKTFGSDKRSFWDGGLVMDTFLSCAESPIVAGGVKNFFRADCFESSAPHCPKLPRVPISQIRIQTAEKKNLSNEPIGVHWMTSLRVPDELRTWRGACVNHYMHKSRDLTTLKRLYRGDANSRTRARLRRTVGNKDYKIFDSNDNFDYSIHRHRANTISVMNSLLDVVEIRQQHYESMKWYHAAIINILCNDD